MILFSWCGIALCFMVGAKLFDSFCSYRRLAEVFVIPFLVACVVLVIGVYIWDALHLSGWLFVIIGGGFLVCVTACLLLLSNLLFFRNGYALFVYERVMLIVGKSPGGR